MGRVDPELCSASSIRKPLLFFHSQRQTRQNEKPWYSLWLLVHQWISSTTRNKRSNISPESVLCWFLYARWLSAANRNPRRWWLLDLWKKMLFQMVSVAWDKDIELILYVHLGDQRKPDTWTWQHSICGKEVDDLKHVICLGLVVKRSCWLWECQGRFTQCSLSNKQPCEVDFTKPGGYFHQHIIHRISFLFTWRHAVSPLRFCGTDRISVTVPEHH